MILTFSTLKNLSQVLLTLKRLTLKISSLARSIPIETFYSGFFGGGAAEGGGGVSPPFFLRRRAPPRSAAEGGRRPPR